MGFFGGSPQFDYKQIGGPQVNQMVGGLNNFDPSSYDPSLGLAGRMYKQSLQQFMTPGGADFSKNSLVAPGLAAIKSNAANANAMAGRRVASGDAAMANSGHLADVKAQLTNQNNQMAGTQGADLVAGAQDRAAGGYQSALNAKRQVGLGRAGLGLQGKESALQQYLASFRGPTGFNPSIFSDIQGVGGMVLGSAAAV